MVDFSTIESKVADGQIMNQVLDTILDIMVHV